MNIKDGGVGTRMVNSMFALGALASLDELGKHRGFVIPDRAAHDKLVKWLRDQVLRV